MKHNQKLGMAILAVIGLLTISPLFQNCAKTNYDLESNSSTNGNSSITGSGDTRKVSINTSFSQSKANMKVLFVVDDSYTMSQSQTLLANAIDSLLNPLQGHNVEFKIVSTSGIPSNEVDYNITTKYLTEQKVEITQSQASALSSYLVQKSVVTNPMLRHNPLRLYKESTPTQFTQLKNIIKNTILSVGVNGSDTEEGLCTTARQLFDDSANRFFKPGDKTAIVILSDENDSSVFSKCVTRYIQRVSSQPVVYYTYGQQRAKLTLEFQLTRDGVTDWYPVVWGVGLSGPQTIVNGDPCTSSHQSYAENKLTTQGYVIRNVSACVYETIPSTYYGSDLGDNGSDVTKNLCTGPFYYNNAYYSNIYDLVNNSSLSAQTGSCVKQTLPSNTFSDYIESDSVIKNDIPSYNAQDLSYAIKNKSTELFGASGFTVASIVHKLGESCTLASGQSYGSLYEGLSQLLGVGNSTLTSICNSSFASTLSQVSNYIVSEANVSYVVSDLKNNEYISSVAVIRGGVKTKLTSSEFEAVRATITLTNFAVQSGDVLEVEIKKTSN